MRIYLGSRDQIVWGAEAKSLEQRRQGDLGNAARYPEIAYQRHVAAPTMNPSTAQFVFYVYHTISAATILVCTSKQPGDSS